MIRSSQSFPSSLPAPISLLSSAFKVILQVTAVECRLAFQKGVKNEEEHTFQPFLGSVMYFDETLFNVEIHSKKARCCRSIRLHRERQEKMIAAHNIEGHNVKLQVHIVDYGDLLSGS